MQGQTSIATSERGRFAPSPSGDLHIGSLLTAVGSWLCAKHAAGKWLLRIDDLDPAREIPGANARILAALAAFGLSPDAPPVFQSKRQNAYDAAFARLQARGEVFPCGCSRQDLARHGGKHRDGRCLQPVQPGRVPAWRLKMPPLQLGFEDLSQGPQTQALREEVGDFVIRRVEGYYSYHLATVLDDAWQGVSEVVRGADLLSSTPRQIYLQRLLDLPTPRYRHLPLATDGAGYKWSKSTAAPPLPLDDPLPVLRRCLRFLGQAVGDADDAACLLEHALAGFDPAALPRHDRRFEV